MKASILVVCMCSAGSALALEAPRHDPFQWPGFQSEEAPVQLGSTPLSRVELDQLRVTGVVVGTSTPTAMVELPDGSAHTARAGDAMGTHGGTVVSVSQKGVTVEQVSVTWSGITHRTRVLLPLGAPAAQ